MATFDGALLPASSDGLMPAMTVSLLQLIGMRSNRVHYKFLVQLTNCARIERIVHVQAILRRQPIDSIGSEFDYNVRVRPNDRSRRLTETATLSISRMSCEYCPV